MEMGRRGRQAHGDLINCKADGTGGKVFSVLCLVEKTWSGGSPLLCRMDNGRKYNIKSWY
jgi:hypothetical protein